MTIVEIIRTYGKIIDLVSSNIRYDSKALIRKINEDLDFKYSNFIKISSTKVKGTPRRISY